MPARLTLQRCQRVAFTEETVAERMNLQNEHDRFLTVLFLFADIVLRHDSRREENDEFCLTGLVK